ncbi:elongation factor P [Thiohalorhabdus sp.]|uniref:elongation factor P n=1 Tax=Thiohalorhabdus sp. TaxID=3094134 RepID=UPI002FC2B3B4
MKIEALQIRKGNIIEYEGGLWRVLKAEHTKPGKGGAFVQTELKNIETGTKTTNRFRSEEKVEKAHIEPRKMEFLYHDGANYIFMDQGTFEQIALDEETLEGVTEFLQPNLEVDVLFHNERPIGVELPKAVELKVVDAEPVVTGQTADATYKPAHLETGVTVQVPQFVEAGDVIRVSTADGTYEERVKQG